MFSQGSLHVYVACRNTYRYLELLLMHMRWRARTFKSCRLFYYEIVKSVFLQRWVLQAYTKVFGGEFGGYAYFIGEVVYQLLYEKSCSCGDRGKVF